MSKENSQKLRELKKNWIHGMSQNKLQQRVEQLLDHMEELLKGLKSYEG